MNSSIFFFLHQRPWKTAHHQPFSIISLLKWTNAMPSIFIHMTCLPNLLAFTCFGIFPLRHSLQISLQPPKQVVIIASCVWQRAFLLIQYWIQWVGLQQRCGVDSHSTCEPAQPWSSPAALLPHCILPVLCLCILPKEECFALVLISSLLLSGKISYL